MHDCAYAGLSMVSSWLFSNIREYPLALDRLRPSPRGHKLVRPPAERLREIKGTWKITDIKEAVS
ncbi:hypothetical protein FA95DRAFT_1566697 [Auriscalpium vulgare]|uniref:Uncharacterized protein n=1 Tax=Auriscalpium vulgare TaxID=40419 RepID=A0ACB8R7V0_9AGAM|nr:hypothetical protein FA95DRAFT_1566697 [Auriscalpium vulgare]